MCLGWDSELLCHSAIRLAGMKNTNDVSRKVRILCLLPAGIEMEK
jgi:hypothetical protein